MFAVASCSLSEDSIPKRPRQSNIPVDFLNFIILSTAIYTAIPVDVFSRITR